MFLTVLPDSERMTSFTASVRHDYCIQWRNSSTYSGVLCCYFYIRKRASLLTTYAVCRSPANALPRRRHTCKQCSAVTTNTSPFLYLPFSFPEYAFLNDSGTFSGPGSSGILSKNDKLELIEGILVEKMTKGSDHLATTWLLEEFVRPALPPGYFLVSESPIRLLRSEPEPDLMVLRGRASHYIGRKPTPGDVALVVEVSDSSLAEDRARAPLFAEAGIPAYWVVNIPDRRIEVYSDPAGHSFVLAAREGRSGE